MSPPTKKRRRRWLLAIAALVSGTALAVGVAEILLRVFDPIGLNYQKEAGMFLSTLQYAWEGTPPEQVDFDGHLFRLKPSIDVDLGSFRIHANHLGVRGPELSDAKPDGTFRVLLLGDSVAFGWGVDDEATFARRLEREWNAAGNRRQLEVVNSGLPMYDTVQQAATLCDLLPRLRPDLVLLVYVSNDVEPTRDAAEALLLGKQPDPAENVDIPHDFWSRAGTTLHPILPALGQLLAAQTNIERRVRQHLGDRIYSPETFGKGPRGWPRSQKALRDIRDRCKAAQVPLLVLDHTRPEIPSLPPFCAAEDIAIAPFRFSDQDLATGICNSLLDSHANAKGHDLLLQRLRAVLRERNLLPR